MSSEKEVANYFSEQGFRVINCEPESKSVLEQIQEVPPLVTELEELFNFEWSEIREKVFVPGLPDLLVFKAETFFDEVTDVEDIAFVEVKTDKGGLSPRQMSWISKWNECLPVFVGVPRGHRGLDVFQIAVEEVVSHTPDIEFPEEYPKISNSLENFESSE